MKIHELMSALPDAFAAIKHKMPDFINWAEDLDKEINKLNPELLLFLMLGCDNIPSNIRDEIIKCIAEHEMESAILLAAKVPLSPEERKVLLHAATDDPQNALWAISYLPGLTEDLVQDMLSAIAHNPAASAIAVTTLRLTAEQRLPLIKTASSESMWADLALKCKSLTPAEIEILKKSQGNNM